MTKEFSEAYKNQVIIGGAIAFVVGLIASVGAVFSNPICLTAL